MKSSNTVESKRLAKVDGLIADLVGCYTGNPAELRLQLLEAVASRLGGFDLEAFQLRFGIVPASDVNQLVYDAKCVIQAIEETRIHPSLCLSALARETLDDASRRSNGAYHTDFRLALHLARSLEDKLVPGVRIIDPACGAGMLLSAVSVVACGSDRILANDWLRHCVYAADLSLLALRGTLLSLAALTDDLDALQEMRSKWRVQDSLLASDDIWHDLAPDAFDIVVANPPWEKVKLSRHEYVKANGTVRDYGTSYKDDSLSGYETAKLEKARLASKLVTRYPSLASGEPDLYVAFTELLLKLTRPGGSGALLVPAGLIRSLNTQHLRAELISFSKDLSFTVLDNRARHFSIDTRFKFLLVNYVKSYGKEKSLNKIGISHARANDDEVTASPSVKLSLATLKRLRPDLTLPEVRSAAEWNLFKKIQIKGLSSNSPDSPWYPHFCREVDMTHGRSHFLKSPELNCLPLIEGRMVQPYRLGCKSYLSGEGRSAKWQNLVPGQSVIKPQFWMPINVISPSAKGRIQRNRVGFCDITGQTNERSMMATLIPPEFVCGNKVPTVEFPNDPSEDRLLLWLSIVNSLPFDWLLRRVVTTTVNYFVLLSIRLPDFDITSLPAQRLIEIARQLVVLDKSQHVSFDLLWRIAMLRAEADVLVANAYGCTETDLRLMLEDFPLIDRGQLPLPGQNRSTVTADLLLTTWGRRKSCIDADEVMRLRQAKGSGAIAYLSSEFSASTHAFKELVHEQ